MSQSNAKKLPEAVFWDWDGTIADSYSFLNDAHNHTLVKLGFNAFEEDEYKAYFGKPRDALYPTIYKEKHLEAMEIFQEYVFENAHNVQVLPHVKPVLEFFADRGIPMGIVSNKKANFIAEELRHTGLADFFQILIGAGEAQADKPSGAPLRLALERTSITAPPENIWYVGDTENDLACANDVGCPALFLKGHADTDALLQKYPPLISFDNYSQLREFLVAI